MQNIYFILIKSKNHIFNHLSKTQNIFKTTKKKNIMGMMLYRNQYIHQV